jgi:hypothetical protein
MTLQDSPALPHKTHYMTHCPCQAHCRIDHWCKESMPPHQEGCTAPQDTTELWQGWCPVGRRSQQDRSRCYKQQWHSERPQRHCSECRQDRGCSLPRQARCRTQLYTAEWCCSSSRRGTHTLLCSFPCRSRCSLPPRLRIGRQGMRCSSPHPEDYRTPPGKAAPWSSSTQVGMRTRRSNCQCKKKKQMLHRTALRGMGCTWPPH